MNKWGKAVVISWKLKQANSQVYILNNYNPLQFKSKNNKPGFNIMISKGKKKELEKSKSMLIF